LNQNEYLGERALFFKEKKDRDCRGEGWFRIILFRKRRFWYCNWYKYERLFIK
jgi:hypothetical protein